MALTRKYLSALGIEADKIDEIINSHAETVDALKAQIEDYKKSVANLQTQIDENKKDAGYLDKYNLLKEEFDNYKEEQKSKEAKAKIENAYKELLKEAGVSEKRIGAVLKVTDLTGVEIEDNGKVKNHDSLMENIKTEWSDFITSTDTKGAQTTTPPSNTGGSPLTKKDIMAIKDTTERQAKIAENHELFGF